MALTELDKRVRAYARACLAEQQALKALTDLQGSILSTATTASQNPDLGPRAGTVWDALSAPCYYWTTHTAAKAMDGDLKLGSCGTLEHLAKASINEAYWTPVLVNTLCRDIECYPGDPAYLVYLLGLTSPLVSKPQVRDALRRRLDAGKPVHPRVDGMRRLATLEKDLKSKKASRNRAATAVIDLVNPGDGWVLAQSEGKILVVSKGQVLLQDTNLHARTDAAPRPQEGA